MAGLRKKQGMNKIESQIPGRLAHDENGFTLIEVLVALALLTMGMVMWAVVSGNVAMQNANVGHATTAITLAQDKIEDIKNTRMTVTGTSGTHEELVYLNQSGIGSLASPVWDDVNELWIASSGDTVDAVEATGNNKAFYTRSWTIEPASGVTNATNLMDIEVTVTWNNAAKSKTLSTRVSQ